MKCKRYRIYVAGPYSPKNCDLHTAIAQGYRNTEKAIEVGIELIKKGHLVYIPHLSHFLHINKNCPLNVKWYEFDNSFIDDWANALFYISSSKGADEELKRAKKLGLRIFTVLSEVPTAEGSLLGDNHDE